MSSSARAALAVPAAAALLAVIGAASCRFHDDRKLAPCTTTPECMAPLVCTQGYCLQPDGGGGEPRAESALDYPPSEVPPGDVEIPDLPPDLPPNVEIVAPKPGETLSAPSFKFKATATMPGSGVTFRWKFDDGTCGGSPCKNPCQMGPIPLDTGTTYTKEMQIAAGGAGERCTGKALGDLHRGAWLFEAQVGAERASAGFTIP